ncbi:MAG TPA: hypothetical protein VHB21_04525 [Minicystis sp.]|nr:hypothetical protein [Minicystis sp.]
MATEENAPGIVTLDDHLGATKRALTRGAVVVLTFAALVVAAMFGELAGLTSFHVSVPLGLGFAAVLWIVGAHLLHLGVSTAGKTAWALGRRAARDLSRFDRRDAWHDALGGRTLKSLGGLLAWLLVAGLLLRASTGVAGVGAIAGASLLLLARADVIRVAQVGSGLALVRRLATTTLAELRRGDGGVELALRVSSAAPTFSLPFLAAPVAAAQIRAGDEPAADTCTWPETLAVEDASGSGVLHLAAFELSGARRGGGTLTRRATGPDPLLANLEQAAGRKLGAREAPASFLFGVWTVEPGDALYVIGDAPAVRRGVGAYRGEGGGAAVHGASDRAAIAFVGDEATLMAALARELRAQIVACAVTLVGAAAFASAGWLALR